MKLPVWVTRPTTLGALLVVSLAVNLFLGGIVAGHFGAEKMRPPPLFAPGTDTLFRLMPGRERRAMREYLHANHPEVMEAHLHLRKLHREIAQELGKDTPDRNLLEHKLSEVRESVELLERSMHTAFLDTVLNMPTRERRQLLKDMRRPPPRGMPVPVQDRTPPIGPDVGKVNVPPPPPPEGADAPPEE